MPVQAELVKSVVSKPNQEVSRETLPAAKVCEGKERRCADGSRAGLVLPSCELVCPEDNRKDLSCYQGIADDSGEYEFRWVEREVPGTPVIYSAGESWSGSSERGFNCTVFELVRQSMIPAESFRRPANHRPLKVAPAL
jgi:hypothetical protein